MATAPHRTPLLSLPAWRVSCPAAAQLQCIRVNVADQAVASSSAPTCASLSSPPFSPRQGRAVLATSFFSSTDVAAMFAPLAAFLHRVIYQARALLLHPLTARHSASPRRCFADRCLSPSSLWPCPRAPSSRAGSTSQAVTVPTIVSLSLPLRWSHCRCARRRSSMSSSKACAAPRRLTLKLHGRLLSHALWSSSSTVVPPSEPRGAAPFSSHWCQGIAHRVAAAALLLLS
jgi:hypothetical protein